MRLRFACRSGTGAGVECPGGLFSCASVLGRGNVRTNSQPVRPSGATDVLPLTNHVFQVWKCSAEVCYDASVCFLKRHGVGWSPPVSLSFFPSLGGACELPTKQSSVRQGGVRDSNPQHTGLYPGRSASWRTAAGVTFNLRDSRTENFTTFRRERQRHLVATPAPWCKFTCTLRRTWCRLEPFPGAEGRR